MKRTSSGACVMSTAAALLVSSALIPRIARSDSLDSVSSVVSHLQAQEDRVRSLKCSYVVRTIPTDPSVLAVLQRLIANRRAPGTYVIDAETANTLGKKYQVLRDGTKESRRQLPLDSKEPWDSADRVAFDGLFVRSLAYPEAGAPVGQLLKPELAHWGDAIELSPLMALHMLLEKPMSSLIKGAADAKVVTTGDGAKLTFTHPEFPDMRIDMRFNRSGDLVERDMYRMFRSFDPKPRLYERYYFEDYRDDIDELGQRIRYPYRVRVKHFAGEDQGRPVVAFEEDLVVESIDFNPVIDASEFVFDFPADVAVYDTVNELGLIAPSGNAPRPVLETSEVEDWNWLWRFLIPGALLIVAVTLFAAVRIRR